MDAGDEETQCPTAVEEDLAAEQIEALDAVGALVDGVEPVVAIVLLDIVVACVAGAAHDLDGEAVGLEAPLRGEALGDGGEQAEQGECLVGRLAFEGVRIVDEARAIEHEGERALDIGLLRQQHSPHIGVLGQGDLWLGGLGTEWPTLEALARIGEGLQIAGVADSRAGNPDAEARLVHHREHDWQPLADGADEVADRASCTPRPMGSVAEHGRGVDGAPRAHLVVDASEDDIVALPEGTILCDKAFRHNEDRDALGAGCGVRGAGQHEMDDVVRQLVIAAGDPHLAAEESIGPVVLGDGSREQVSEIGPGRGLGQGHGAGEATLRQWLGEESPLLVRAVGADEVGRGHAEQGVAGGRGVGRVEPGETGGDHARRQALAAVALGHPGREETRIGKGPQRRAHLGDEGDRRPVEAGLLQVVGAGMRRETLGRHGLGEFEHGPRGLA